MNREIKFRAWSNEHNRYCDFVTLDENGRWIGWIKSGGVYLTTVDIVLEQSTSLKDKNGKEIYEGDIVEQFVCGIHHFKGKKGGRSTIWQVRWNKKECCFELHYLNGSLFGDSMMSDGDEYEVIGTYTKIQNC